VDVPFSSQISLPQAAIGRISFAVPPSNSQKIKENDKG
jgi:hypothetical protein